MGKMMKMWIALLVIVTFAAAAEARTTPLLGTPPERLFELIATEGKIAVIVGVHVDGGWKAEDNRIPEKAARQRQNARQTKDRVLRAHPQARRIADRDFKHIPYFTLVVGADELRALMEDDDVTHIGENEKGERTLAESTVIVGANLAYNRGYRGAGWEVVVMDDGVDRFHSAFYPRIPDSEQACFSGADNAVQDPATGEWTSAFSLCPGQRTSDFSPGAGDPCPGCTHGTRVAGVAAAGNATIRGVAPGAYILPVQVYSKNTPLCSTPSCTWVLKTDLLAALDWMYSQSWRTGYAAVNLSFIFPEGAYTTRSSCIAANGPLDAAVANLWFANIPVVAGIGNKGNTKSYAPACLNYAISVGATNDDDSVALYSSHTNYLDFMAPGGRGKPVTGGWVLVPGQGIWTANPGNGYVEDLGTSLAAPHVAGAFAVLRGAVPWQTHSVRLYDALRATGTPVQLPYPSTAVVPRINVNAALSVLVP